jgi:hypothetical protein
MHEVLSRGRGGSPTDPENILCLCRGCHKWITEHPEQATALGWLRARTATEHGALYRVPRRTVPNGGIVGS